MRDIPVARCEGKAHLFTSVDRRDHSEAKAACLGRWAEDRCPLFKTCEATVVDILAGRQRDGLHGTWAGKLYGRHTHKPPTAALTFGSQERERERT